MFFFSFSICMLVVTVFETTAETEFGMTARASSSPFTWVLNLYFQQTECLCLYCFYFLHAFLFRFSLILFRGLHVPFHHVIYCHQFSFFVFIYGYNNRSKVYNNKSTAYNTETNEYNKEL